MEPITPGIEIQERQAGVVAITSVESRIPTFIGVTKRGPTDKATLVTSLRDFEAIFGGPTSANPAMWIAVRGFFANAGSGVPLLWIVRIVRHLVQGDPESQQATVGSITLQTSAGAATSATIPTVNLFPIALTANDILDFGAIDAGSGTATFLATAGTVTAGNAEPYALVAGDTIQIVSDDFQAITATFTSGQFPAIGAATAAEVVASINGQLPGSFLYAFDSGGSVALRSQTEGTDGVIQVLGGTGNTAGKLNFSTTPANGTGNVADISEVTGVEFETVVEADTTAAVELSGLFASIVSPTTGPTSSLQINAGPVQVALGLPIITVNGTDGSAVDTLVLDGRTAYDNSDTLVRIQIPASSGDPTRFDLSVDEAGIEVERFRDLTMDPTSDQYVETIMNAEIGNGGSPRFLATDQNAQSADPRPAVGTSAFALGGGDGLSGLSDLDFLGGVGIANTKTGLRSIDVLLGTQTAPQMLGMPGRNSSAIYAGQVEYAQIGGVANGQMFVILASTDTTTATAHRQALVDAGMVGTTEYAASYYPNVLIANPNPTIFGADARLEVDYLGYVAGVYARRDTSEEFGVGKPPGGYNDFGKLVGVVGVSDETITDVSQRTLIGLANSNPLAPRNAPTTATEALPIFVGDVLTQSRTSDGARFSQIQQRRFVIWVESSLAFSFQPKLLADNTASTRRSFLNQTTKFLDAPKEVGVLTEFVVDIGPTVNTPARRDAGIFVMEISLKPVNAIRSIRIVVQPIGTE